MRTDNLKVKTGITTSLGVTIFKDGVNFAIAAEDNKKCSLAIYDEAAEPFLTIDFKSEYKFGDVYTVFVEYMPEKKYRYIYYIDNKRYIDPYAKRIVGRELWGKPVEEDKIFAAFSFDEYDWENDKPLKIPYSEVISYALHVRGFTKHSSSKVKHRGTYEGIIEKIPYLKELGINQIELMPSYEFDEITPRHKVNMEFKEYVKDKEYSINYWGYTMGCYFAPKASYSKAADPVSSFKNMVKELHKSGIEIIMEFYFPKNVNYNLIIDCIVYWVEEYHIDGVHINCENAPVIAVSTYPRLSHTKIMSGGFDLSSIYPDGKIPSFKNIAEYNDGFLVDARRFLKGDEDILEQIAYRIRRNPDKCAVINYIAGHNGFNLMDMVSYDVKHNEENGENNKDGNNYNFSWNCGAEGRTRKKAVLELRNRQIKNALVLLILSQGVPMLLSGDEIGNTQNGNNNPYCQDNTVSWIDWSGVSRHTDILNFTKKLISFRKEHSILHSETELRIMDYLSCGYPDLSYHGKKAWYPEFENYNRQIGIMYCGKYAAKKGEEAVFIYFAYNMHWIPHEFALPNLPKKQKWRVAIDTGSSTIDETELKDQRNITVKSRTILILIGK